MPVCEQINLNTFLGPKSENYILIHFNEEYFQENRIDERNGRRNFRRRRQRILIRGPLAVQRNRWNLPEIPRDWNR